MEDERKASEYKGLWNLIETLSTIFFFNHLSALLWTP